MDRRAIEDIFHPCGPVAIKRMFGGHGVYCEGMMFALEAGGEIYLKTDPETLPAFETAGLRPFEFESKRGRMVTSYRLLPEEAHDDDDVLKHWCGLALDAARRAAQAKSQKAKTKSARTKPKA